MTRSPLRRVLSVIRRQADPDASGPLADDRLLARFAKNGDASAFELLVWRHGTMVLGTCRRILGDHHLAEDAFQATFLALARKPRAVRNGAALGGWLHRVAKRIAVRARHDSARSLNRDRCVARSELIAAPDVLSAEATAIIDEEIDRLPDWQRRPVVLCYLDGHTAEQAAAMLGCPRGTILSRLAAAKERLRSRLTRRGLALQAGGFAISLGAAEVSAAMVSTTAKAVLGGGASVQVIGWAQGVIYAMFLSKIKLATAAVLTTGMIGAGVGWVAVPGSGSAVVGEAHADDRANREREEAVRQRQLAEEARAQAEKARMAEMQARDMAEKARAELQASQMRLEQALTQLKLLEDRQAASSRTALTEQIGLMEKELMQLELSLKRALSKYGRGHPDVVAIERDIQHLRERMAKPIQATQSRDDLQTLERQLADLMTMQADRDQKRSDELVGLRSRLAQEEERFKAMDREQLAEVEWLLKTMTEGRSGLEKEKQILAQLLETHGREHPDVARRESALRDASKTLDRLNADLTERQTKALKQRMQAREAMVRFEEEAKRVERRAAIEEREWAEKRAVIQDRLRATGKGASMAGDARLADIERKLDTLARELSELRREMKK